MVTIKLNNKATAFLIVTITLISLIGLGIAYGTSNPPVFGHSMGEIALGENKCIFNQSNTGVATIAFGNMTTLLIDGVNICEGPSGCDIFIYSMDDTTGDINGISSGSGIYIQEQGTGRYVSNVGAINSGINGWTSSVLGSLGGCVLYDDFAETSQEIFGLVDNDISNSCAVSICSRQ